MIFDNYEGSICCVNGGRCGLAFSSDGSLVPTASVLRFASPWVLAKHGDSSEYKSGPRTTDSDDDDAIGQ